MATFRATHTFTQRLADSLLDGPESVIDLALPYIDRERVPELLQLVDDRLAGLRHLRHQLETLAAEPDQFKRCDRCGAEYLPRSHGSRFCSNACRQAAHRNGRKA